MTLGTGNGMFDTVKVLGEDHPFPWSDDIDPVGGSVIVDANGDTVITLGVGKQWEELSIRVCSYINNHVEKE